MSDISSVTVIALQGNDVSSAAPADGDVLTWDAGASEWQPVAPAAPVFESWVGTPNTQAQTIRKVPFVCSLTGVSGQFATSNVWSFTLASGKAFSLAVWSVSRKATSVNGSRADAQIFTGWSNGSSVTLYNTNSGNSLGSSVTASNAPDFGFGLTSSGTTVTLQASLFAATGVVVDAQGYVELMII